VTQYQFFGSVNGGNGAVGPASSTSYSSTIVMGIAFEVTSPGLYFYGYQFWRCDSAQSASASFGLWIQTAADTGTYQGSGTAASTSTMVAGQFNTVLLATPFALTPSTPYKAVVGFTGNFPQTITQFGNEGGSGAPYTAGITNGPIFAYSGPVSFGGSATIGGFTNAYQCSYDTSSANPATDFPAADDDCFWCGLDVLIGTAASGVPASVTGIGGVAARPYTQVIVAGRAGSGHSY
jgi:hypothetical protein